MNMRQILPKVEKLRLETESPSKYSDRDIRNCRDFLKYFYETLPKSLKFDATFFGRGICHSLGVTLDLEITDNVPSSYRRGIRTAAGAVLSPPLTRWFSSRSPYIYELPATQTSAWERNFAKHGYRNMAIHGFTDHASGRITILGFYNFKKEDDSIDIHSILN